MYPGGIYALIKDVLSSWEVIVVTLAMLLFIKIVFAVSSTYRRPRVSKKPPKAKKPKPEAAPPPEDSDEIHEEERPSDDEEPEVKEE